VQAVMGLHSVGCSGWYIDAVAYLSGLCSGFESCVGLWVCSVAYLSGLCSGFESCVGLWVCSVGVDGVCSGLASNKAHTHTVAIDGFTSLPIIITQQDASHPLKSSSLSSSAQLHRVS
jgi:hypothetical protein